MQDLKVIFDQLKPLLMTYQPPFQPKREDERYYDLWSFKNIEIDGRKRKEVYFAAIIIQKSYVGFYFMPVYAEPEVKNLFKPELLSKLKGKSCFHIRKLDAKLLEQIEESLKVGYELYLKRDWVDL